MSETDISLRARFERFPATVKGAFVVRGEDANPHQVSVLESRVVSVAGSVSVPLPVKPAILDCPPHQDMFLPFEFPITELEPGWYGLECDLLVDAAPRTVDGGRRFVVQWPRATVRRGTVKIGVDMALGDLRVALEQVDCATDHALLHFQVVPPAPVALRMTADGSPLVQLDLELDEETGRGALRTYPILRSHMSLHIAARGRGKTEAEEELRLP